MHQQVQVLVHTCLTAVRLLESLRADKEVPEVHAVAIHRHLHIFLPMKAAKTFFQIKKLRS